MRLFRDLRLIPVVVLAAAALFLLKVSAIVIEGGYTLIASRVALAQGLGEGVKTYDMPPVAPLEETASAAPVDRARSWVRDIYAPAEYPGSVAAAKPEGSAPPAAAAEMPAAAAAADPL